MLDGRSFEIKSVPLPPPSQFHTRVYSSVAGGSACTPELRGALTTHVTFGGPTPSCSSYVPGVQVATPFWFSLHQKASDGATSGECDDDEAGRGGAGGGYCDPSDAGFLRMEHRDGGGVDENE